MTKVAKSMVPFTVENITQKCQCGQCPVQGGSSCVVGLAGGLEEVLKENPLQKEEIPGEYCAQGTAACGDLSFSEGCVCPTCDLFNDYVLSGGYFCKNGAAG